MLKRMLEAVLARSGISGMARLGFRSGQLVLAYHNIVPDDVEISGDRSLHLSRRRFSDQLDLLVETGEVVPLSAILEKPADSARPRVAITFDDAYRGAVTIGVEELAKRGLPATIFVAPAFVGGRSYWWDTLVGGRGERAMTAEFRKLALERYRGEDRRVRDSAAEHGMQVAVADGVLVTATEGELGDAAAVPGITLGSHSWSHPNLALLQPSELSAELMEPLHWLRARFDNVIPWLSYPYGFSSELVEQAAAEAGYEAALLVSGGWMKERPRSRYALPRFNVPAGLSNHGFALRLAGWFAAGQM